MRRSGSGIWTAPQHLERAGASSLPVEAEVDARHGGDLIADRHGGIQLAARVRHHHGKPAAAQAPQLPFG